MHEHQLGSLERAYRQLGLPSHASLADVKQAYRRLALQCHPDLHGKGNEEFVRITSAYERIIGRSSSPTLSTPYTAYRPYSARRSFQRQSMAVCGFGLALGCLLFGSVFLWTKSQIHRNGAYLRNGPRRFVEPSSDSQKRQRIAAILLQKSTNQKDKET